MKYFIISTLFLISSALFAKVEILNSYIKTVPPGVNATAAFATIKNSTKKDLFLVTVKSKLAEFVEIHNTSMKDGMMEMRKIESLKIPAGKSLELKPGGLHIMLIYLQKKLVEGEEHEVEFVFKNKLKLVKKLKITKID